MGRRYELEGNKRATLDNLRDLVMSLADSFDCSLADIARHVSVQPDTLYNWLHGRAVPNIEDLAYLCSMGGVGIDDILVRNYEVNYHNLEEQRECFAKLQLEISEREKNSTCEEDVDLDIEYTIILNEKEKLDSEVTTLNEAMMFFSIMDDKTLHYLQNRLRFVGITNSDQKYIWRQFTYVINSVMPDDEAKQHYQNEINLCTHNPYLLRTCDRSMDFKQNMVENYFSSFRKELSLNERWFEGKYDIEHSKQNLMDTFEILWNKYPKMSFCEFLKMVLNNESNDWNFDDCILQEALLKCEKKLIECEKD